MRCSKKEKYIGALIGAAIGDALGGQMNKIVKTLEKIEIA